MSNRVLVVEANQDAFDLWNDAQYGVGAQLETLGGNTDGLTIERIDTAEDLSEVAVEIKRSVHLPARALVLQDPGTTDLSRRPINDFTRESLIEPPADFDDRNEGWTYKGDTHSPLAPYARLMAGRLVRQAVPSVDFYPAFESYDTLEHATDILEWRYAMAGCDDLIPKIGGYLNMLNKHLAVTGQDFMSIVDSVGATQYHYDYSNNPGGSRRMRTTTTPIEGADIDAIYAFGINPAVAPKRWNETWTKLRQMTLVAHMLKGEYPDATEVFADLAQVMPMTDPNAEVHPRFAHLM